MFEDHNDSVYEAVRSSGLIDHSSLEDTNEQHLHPGKSLAEALIDAELTTRDGLLQIMAEFLGYERIANLPTEVDAEVLSLVRPDLARMYGVVPIRADEVSISVLAK